MKRWGGILGIVIALMPLLAVGCAGQADDVGVVKGKVAPDFSLPTLDGGADNLRNYRGRVVVLNFWATWCGPCRAEVPDLQAVYGELRERGLVVLGVNQGESRDKVKSFVREFGVSFPVVTDEAGTVGRTFGVRAFPTTFIIDKKGVIQEVIVGGPLSRTMIRRQVEGLLK